MDHTQWLVEFVRFFRALHFFEKYASMSDEALANLLAKWYVAAWERPIDLRDRLIDLRLISSDEARVWWRDLRIEVKEEAKMYVGLLSELSVISRGVFVPTDMDERWDDYRGPIVVSFSYHGDLLRVYPRFIGDELDIEVVFPISRIIEKTGVQFFIYKKFDDTALVVALTQQEKQLLEQYRGWQFEV